MDKSKFNILELEIKDSLCLPNTSAYSFSLERLLFLRINQVICLFILINQVELVC